MSSCEKCWNDSFVFYRNGYGAFETHSDAYYFLLKERERRGQVCTPKEQAGQFWDEKKQRDRRDFITVKPRQKQRNALNSNSKFRGRRGK